MTNWTPRERRMAARGFVYGPRYQGYAERDKIRDLTGRDRRDLMFDNRSYDVRPVDMVRLVGGTSSGNLYPWPADDRSIITIIGVGSYERSVINAKLAHYKLL